MTDIWDAFKVINDSFVNKNDKNKGISQTNVDQTNVGQTKVGQTNVGQTNVGQTNVGQTNVSQKDNNDRYSCNYCNKTELIVEEGSLVCRDCGCTNAQLIDHGQEWRYYGSSDNRSSNPSRCGMPINPLLPKSSMGTILQGWGNEKYRRLMKWNSVEYKEKSLMDIFKMMKYNCSKNNIPSCVFDRATVMYKMISEAAIKRGASRMSIIAACVYYSCKDKNISKNRKEISKIFSITNSKMTSGCNQFKEILFKMNPKYINSIKPNSVEDYINRYSILLNLGKKYREQSIILTDRADKYGIVMDNIPSSIAAGGIYLIIQHNKLNISKKKMKEVCEISEVTISKTYKILKTLSSILLRDI